jgi:hypothetical protein
MGRTEMLKVMVDPDLKLRLQAAAQEERRSLSDLIRVVLEDWL